VRRAYRATDGASAWQKCQSGWKKTTARGFPRYVARFGEPSLTVAACTTGVATRAPAAARSATRVRTMRATLTPAAYAAINSSTLGVVPGRRVFVETLKESRRLLTRELTVSREQFGALTTVLIVGRRIVAAATS